MIFFAAVLFAALLFVIPGEILLVILSEHFGRDALESRLILCVLNIAVFVGLLLALRFSRFVYREVGWEDGHLTHRLDALLDVTGWRWLSLWGLVGVGAGVAMLFVGGRIPFPFWFLFGAVLVGLLDLVGARDRGRRPKVRPAPRFAPVPEPKPEPGVPGKSVAFRWQFMDPGSNARPEEKTAEFFLGEAEYTEARARDRFPRRPLAEYARYIKEGLVTSVARIVQYFRDEAGRNDYAAVVEVMNVVGFARGIEYIPDEEGKGVEDYANFPIETLYEEGGDCEDHAILAAALLYELGHDVGLFHLQQRDGGHLALAYRPPAGGIVAGGPFSGTAEDGTEYYYVETVPTDPDRGVGEVSEQFLEGLEQTTVILIE